MLSRIDFAAVYLGLLTGARPPVDSPDGLGRPGRAGAALVDRCQPPADRASHGATRESGSWS